ncbi:hypothetical protein BJP36_21805 [Moorena producens JHB]|uniref:Uncharacterized protein n=1 Tax=Moorena producens (strain JHB) TaxID=1454205 RepID=A0A1D9G3D8_MOOP1|nr:hypothetical protein [Moorena producens]AOY82147.1 hypothetical protein BJP36_21805 [Moorena producens JHB]
MATDYILFIHGVNTRQDRETPQYADKLFDLIQINVESSIQLKKIPLYWGNVVIEQEKELLGALKASKVWNEFWFRDFREKQILQFVGDAALYLSRHVSSLAIEQMSTQAYQGLEGYQDDDRLHLVTHSWGTIILFDVLFASRWDDPTIPGHQSIQEIRKSILGIESEQDSAIPLASVHTMGSPIALFTLIHIVGKTREGSTHDISSKLKELLASLTQQGVGLPWQNFLHPGDPIAWPLEGVLPKLVDEYDKVIKLEDVLTYGSGFLENVAKPVQSTFLALINGGSAHGSYWTSEKVAKKIAETIHQTAKGSYILGSSMKP